LSRYHPVPNSVIPFRVRLEIHSVCLSGRYALLGYDLECLPVIYYITNVAWVAERVDARDLKSLGVYPCTSSSLVPGTNEIKHFRFKNFYRSRL
jgi:hypothetical protein